MATLTSPGIGSGLDVQGLVSKLLAAEGAPATSRLDRKEARLQAELSAIGSLKSVLSTFQSGLAGLLSLSNLNKRTVTSSNTDFFTATAATTAASGSYDIEVKSLAQAQKLASQAFATTSDVLGTGTLTFQYGDPTKPAQTVTITDGSLAGIRDAVNAANIGVRASLIKGDAGYQLVFSAANSGLDNSLKITVSESPADGSNTDMSGLSQLAYDPAAAVGSGKNLTEQVAAADAWVVIDGIDVTQSSNTITDAIEGVTLNLTAAEVGTKTKVTVATDKSGVSSAVQAFVTAYNALHGAFEQLGGYDADTKQGGVLIGDAALRGVSSRIRAVLSAAVPGLSGNYQALADLGIKTQVDGKLTVDTTKLNSAIENNFEEIGRLFAAAGKATDAQVSYVSSTASTAVGEYAVNITQLATQGNYEDTASAVSSLVVDASNDTFVIQVDGTSSGTITLTQTTYASAADLAAELQSRINGDSALSAAGASVVVSYDAINNRFVITSNRYGSDSSVEITSVEDGVASGQIGLTATSSAATAGQDVAGTIGGNEASGSGQYLTATGLAEGLKLQISGDTTGDRGKIAFTRGIADTLNSLLDDMLGSDSFLSSRTDSLNKLIADVNDDREILARRLQALETRYLTQFSALDALLGQLQATSSYLTNQLKSLPGAYSGS